MIKSNNFSLKKWFYILIIIILTNIIILGLFSVVSSTISNNFLNNLGDTNFPLIKNTLLVDMMHDGLRGNVTNALLITATGGSQAEKDEVLNENKEMAKKFKEYIENINKLPLNNELRSLVKEVIPTVNQYVETSAVVIQYSFANNKKAA
ncbi:MAG: MCP four helix bundle domain-containing protein, partial [Silvanigrellaceae bacterium]|nr:MCP four helix bundle domain-containing protein [Silvanigrellaceae bacterium]